MGEVYQLSKTSFIIIIEVHSNTLYVITDYISVLYHTEHNGIHNTD